MQNALGVPGVRTARTATPRKVFITDRGKLYLPKSVIIAGASARDPGNTGDLQFLRAGMPMGKITASGKYAPSVIGVLAAAHDSESTSRTTLTIPAAAAVELNRRFGSSGTTEFALIGPPTAAGTVATTTVSHSAINTSTGAVTITDIAVDVAAGSLIVPNDGSQLPLAIIDDGYPIKVTDDDETDIDVPADGRLAVGGVIDASQLIFGNGAWSDLDASVKLWVLSQLNGGAAATPAKGPFVSDHYY